jgi:hypothetical protein
MWSKGFINGMDYQVEHYSEKSSYGIDGGKISRLWVSKDGEDLVCYDRGGEKKAGNGRKPTALRADCGQI